MTTVCHPENLKPSQNSCSDQKMPEKGIDDAVRGFLKFPYSYYQMKPVFGNNYRLNVFYRTNDVIPKTSLIATYFMEYKDSQLVDRTKK
jgi:hypothetical protein